MTRIEFDPVEREITISAPGPAGPPGRGVPPGGADGQVLAKASGADYDTAWVTGSGGGGLPEAPDDGLLYGRLGKAWSVAEPVGTSAWEAENAVNLHAADTRDVHPQYLLPSEVLPGSGIVVDTVSVPGHVLVSASLVGDHSQLTNLNADDHPQYLNNTRGDARYYRRPIIDSALAEKADVGHVHDNRYLQPPQVLAGRDIVVDTTTTPGSVIIGSTMVGGGISRTGEFAFYGVAGAVPGNAQLTVSDLDLIDTAWLRVSDVDTTGVNQSGYLTAAVREESVVLVQQKNDASRWLSYRVAAAPVDEAGYVELAVVWEATGPGGLPDTANGTRMLVDASSAGGGGVEDHGELTGLDGDDHLQYHTDARGDARYYTQAQVDAALSGKADNTVSITGGVGLSGGGDLTADRQLAVDRAVVDDWYDGAGTAQQLVDAHNAEPLPHIDAGFLTEQSAGNLYDPIGAADAAIGGHLLNPQHDEYQAVAERGQPSGYAPLNTLGAVPFTHLPVGVTDTTVAVGSHGHPGLYYTKSETDDLLAGKANVSHNHDDLYYTKSQIDVALSGKAEAVHTHDDRYYTEAETDGRISDAVDAHEAAEDPHPQYLTDAEGTVLFYPRADVDGLLAGKANVSHNHNTLYYTKAEMDTSLSNKADKVITIGTGDGLTGGGDLSSSRSLSVELGTGLGFHPTTRVVQVNRAVTDTWYAAPGDAGDAIAAHKADKNDPHAAAGYLTQPETDDRYYTKAQSDASLAAKLNKGGDTMSGDLDMDNNRIDGLLEYGIGVSFGPREAVPAWYVDQRASGIDPHPAVAVICRTPLAYPFTGLPEIDGHQLAEGERVLVANQHAGETTMKAAVNNGVWVATATGNWQRAGDESAEGSIAGGSFFHVLYGELWGASGFLGVVRDEDLPWTPGTDDVYFAQFHSRPNFVAGDGLARGDGDTINAVGGVGISVGQDDISIDVAYFSANYYTQAQTNTQISTSISNHVGAADPHAQYQLESGRGVANGYASLDASGDVPFAQLPTGTGSTHVAVGNHTHDTNTISNLDGSDIATGTVVRARLPVGTTGNHVAAGEHVHDGRYYTESEVDTLLAGKSDSSHNHDSRYYTETETDNLLAGKANVSHNHDTLYYTKAQSDAALAGKSNVGHSHNDLYYTESEVDTLLAGKANVSHNHDTLYYTKSQVDASLSGKVNTSVRVLAGNGLTGGGGLTGDVTLTVGAGTGITVNGTSVAINTTYFSTNYYTKTQTDAQITAAIDSHNHDGRYEKSDGDYMPNNPYGGKGSRYSHFDNALFRAERRYTVTATRYSKDTDANLGTVSAANLFDGNYESQFGIAAGEYVVVNINFNGIWPGYPYGYLYVSHYYTDYTESVTGRMYTNYAPHGVGWHPITFARDQEQTPSGSSLILKSSQLYKYQIEQIELTFTAQDDVPAKINQIDFFLDRPGSVNPMPYVSKFNAETLLFPLSLSGDPTNAAHAARKAYVDAGLAGKAPTVHTHDDRYYTETETNNLLAGKANTSHTHSAGDITTGTFAIGRIPTGTTASTVALGNHLHTGVYDPAGSAATRVSKSGDTMTGLLTLSGAPTSNLHAATKAYVDTGLAGKAPTSHNHNDLYYTETEMNGFLATKVETTTTISAGTGLSGGGTLAANRSLSVNRTVTDTWYEAKGAANTRVLKSGDTMTGLLTLSGAPTSALHAATKAYADTKAPAAHTHDDRYYTEEEVDAALAGKAPTSHTHSIANVTGLQAALDGKAPTSHTHPVYLEPDEVVAGSNITVDTTTTPGSVIISGTAAGVTDHGGLSGLADDDHPQYLNNARGDARYPAKTGTGASGSWGISVTGNAGTATRLATARTIALAGDVTGSASFNGSANATITATVVDDSHNHIIANVDGLQTALNGKAATSHTHAYLPLAGGTLTGSLVTRDVDMAWHSLTSVWKTETARLGGLPEQDGGDIGLTNAINADGHTIYGVPDPVSGDQVTNKDYVDSIVGQSDHGSLGGLADDDHLQYAPIAVVNGDDPLPPTAPERRGLLVVRENTTGDELGFLQKQGGTMTGPLLLQSDPTAPLEAATKSYVDDNNALAGYASGMCSNIYLAPGQGESTFTPNTFYRSKNITRQNNELRMDLAGYWQVTMLVYFDITIETNRRAFLTIRGPDHNGAGLSLAYRSSVGLGENFASTNALVYANGTNGQVRFSVYCNNAAANATNTMIFNMAYLGK